ncbi:MAG TPA: hypothetical protein VM286_01910 [Candidatus Thermoplasmatota archaeon]|nr:hypothetical protein [Candidatus Thermoplasmatota archaeon]
MAEVALPTRSWWPSLRIPLYAAAGIALGLLLGTLAAELPESIWSASAGHPHQQIGLLQLLAGGLTLAALGLAAWRTQGRPAFALWLMAIVSAIPPWMAMS